VALEILGHVMYNTCMCIELYATVTHTNTLRFRDLSICTVP